jgi:hypothetical protein
MDGEVAVAVGNVGAMHAAMNSSRRFRRIG